VTRNLNQFSDGTVIDNQVWTHVNGVL